MIIWTTHHTETVTEKKDGKPVTTRKRVCRVHSLCFGSVRQQDHELMAVAGFMRKRAKFKNRIAGRVFNLSEEDGFGVTD